MRGDSSQQAQDIFERDCEWIAPLVWRSEFRNVLSGYMRRSFLSFENATEIIEKAEIMMRGNEFAVTSGDVLRLAFDSQCSAYDCEFVALARDREVPLITSDTQVLSAFPSSTVSPRQFLS